MREQIFIVEDHPLVRRMLCEMIKTTSDMDVCGETASGEEALEHLGGVDPDLLLIDVSLNGMNGIDLVAEVMARWPHFICLMLSGHDGPGYAKRALAAGARGYVAKGNPKEVTAAIRAVLSGETYLSAAVR